jgi:Cu-Zn family superoxide dismutase
MPSRYTIPGDNVYPEGIAYDPGTGYFYVSATGDGAIYRGRLDQPSMELFLPGGGDGRIFCLGLKVDDKGRLYVSGGISGQVYVYDTRTKVLLAKFQAGPPPAGNPPQPGSFINDVALAPNGDAYFTDSFNPVLYRLSTGADGNFTIDSSLNFTGTTLVYKHGATLMENVNLNGIAATPDGKFLIVVQTNTGKLFRVSLDPALAGDPRRVTEIPIEGGNAVGDGMLLEGALLHMARNASEVATFEMDVPFDYDKARFLRSTTDPSFDFPTTLARAGDRFLVVDSQFEKQPPSGPGPTLPFYVTSIPAPIFGAEPGTPPNPAPGMPTTGGAAAATYFWVASGVALVVLGLGAFMLRRARQ